MYNQNNKLGRYDDVSFEYDANGNTIKKTVGSVVTSYVYNIENRLNELWDGEVGTGSLIASYYYDPFGRRGYKPESTWTTDPLFMEEAGQYYFYHNDHLGTPHKLNAVNGEVVWSALYSSFGEATVEIEAVENNLRFPGQYCDAETGLHYNCQRYYDPETGRYITSGPIGLAGGINFFAYVQNNPISVIDFDGRDPAVYDDSYAAYRILTCAAAVGYLKGYKLSAELLTYALVYHKATGLYRFTNSHSHLKNSPHYQKKRNKTLKKICKCPPAKNGTLKLQVKV